MSTYSGKCGKNLEWHYNDVTYELIISGDGMMDDFEAYGESEDNRPWAEYAHKVKTITIGERVRSIGTMAFREFSSLTSIVLPLFMERIGDTAFVDCASLEHVAFEPNYSGNITVIIEYGAFWGCTNLDSVTMPIKGELQDCVFYECSSLRSIRIPEGTKCIQDDTFYNCESLVEVHVPNTVECIEADAFEGCKNLQRVVIPKSVKQIGIFEIKE